MNSYKGTILSFLRSRSKTFYAFVFLFLFAGTVVLAAPPGSPYTANQTLDPSCGPTDTNCYVAGVTVPTNVSSFTNDAGYITSVPTQSFASLTGTPTTLGGYGITDAYTKTASDTRYQTPVTFSTGLTNTSGVVTVNAAQNITSLSNLTSNGLIKTSGGTGILSIATAGTDYLAPTGSGASLTGIPTSISNSDSSLTVSSNTGAVVVSLNTGHSNTWTAKTVFSFSGTPVTPIFGSNTTIQNVGANGNDLVFENRTFGGHYLHENWRADGTAASPTALISGDEILAFAGGGYNGTTDSAEATAAIQMLATENWNSSSQGTDIVFNVTKNATTALTASVKFDNDLSAQFKGAVGVGIFQNPNIAADPSYDGILTVTGSANASDRGVIGVYADTNNTTTTVGEYDFGSTYNTSGYKIARTYSQLVGSSANNKGGNWILQTKQDGGSLTTAISVDQNQNVSIPNGALTIASTTSKESAPLGTELTSSGSWTSTGWTGSQGAGFSHTIGNTNNLSQTLSISAGNYYLVTFTVSSMTTGSVNVSLGGTTSVNGGGDLPSTSNNTFSWAVFATTTAGINFIPTTDFNGTISNISVKQVTGTYPATANINGSNGSSDFEIRSAPTLTTAAYSGPDVFVGQNAGSKNVTGGMLTAIGTGAMQNNISGSEDVAIGYLSQNSEVSGWYNVSVGHLTLSSLLNGYDNAAVGDDSMYQATSAHSNACFGNGTCLSMTTGSGNTALGDHTLDALTTGTENVAIGHGAMTTVNNGSGNIAIGSNALEANTANDQIAIGVSAAAAVTSGVDITAIGNNALAALTTGAHDTAIGFNAMYNATGSYNIGIGESSLANVTGLENIGIGYNSLTTTTSGNYNTAIGYNSMVSNVSGSQNDAYGYYALNANTATGNTALGFSSLSTNTSGGNNTATGANSLAGNSTGGGNTANGFSALTTNTTGVDNTSIGFASLQFNSTGNNNVAVGYEAGRYETGSNDFYVNNIDEVNTSNDKAYSLLYGTFSGTSTSLTGQQLTVNGALNVPSGLSQFGSSSVLTGTTIATFKNAGGTCSIVPSTSGGVTCSSDMNLKKNITLLADGSTWTFNNGIVPDGTSILDKVLTLQPVDYNWNVEQDTDSKHAGFIAQDVQQIFPDLVTQDPTTHLLSLNYAGMVPYTIEAIKEMNISITSIDDLTTPDTWRDALDKWFADSSNGITNFFSKTVSSNEVDTQKLCVGDPGHQTCVTKAQLDQLLSASAQGSGATQENSNTPSSGSSDSSSNDMSQTPPTTDTTQDVTQSADTSDQTVSVPVTDNSASDQTQSSQAGN